LTNAPEGPILEGVRNTLEKVFAVLEVVASGDGPVTLKAIAKRTGHHPSTVSRILADLAEIGYVRKESYREFSLDLGLVPLGQKALSHFPPARLAGPLIAEAAGRLGCHGALAGMHRDRLVYLVRGAPGEAAGALAEDFRYPLHRSNCALALLASRPEEQARRLLAESLAAESGRRSARRLEELLERLAAARRDGYSVLVEEHGWNVAFPLVYRSRPLAAALYGPGAMPAAAEKIVLACSLLVRRIEASWSPAPTEVRGSRRKVQGRDR
jgi:DNA-binding IclR family transcriptional regulator